MRAWVSEFFKPRNKYSLEYFEYLYDQLVENQIITEENESIAVETIRSIAELLIWGDQNESQFFDFFLERNLHVYFLNILHVKKNTFITLQLLQTLNIMFENIRNETSIYYLLSNNYVNQIITHQFDFRNEEILAYYISFLKTLSLKLNKNTVHFFFNEHLNDFPLYTEAIKFFNHEESMIRIAVRTLTLNVYNVRDRRMRDFILHRTSVKYFTELVQYVGKQSLLLDSLVAKDVSRSHKGKIENLIADHEDWFCYMHDIFSLGVTELNDVLTLHILNKLVIPLYVRSLAKSKQFHPLQKEDSPFISPQLAIFLLSQMLCLFKHTPLLNAITAILFVKEIRSDYLDFVRIVPSSGTSEPLSSPLPHQLSDRPTTPIMEEVKAGTISSGQVILTYPEKLPLPMISFVAVEATGQKVKTTAEPDNEANPNQKLTNNIYRETLYGNLSKKSVDNLALLTLCLISIIVNNTGVSPEVLQAADLHPRRTLRHRVLLGVLTTVPSEQDSIAAPVSNLAVPAMKKSLSSSSSMLSRGSSSSEVGSFEGLTNRVLEPVDDLGPLAKSGHSEEDMVATEAHSKQPVEKGNRKDESHPDMTLLKITTSSAESPNNQPDRSVGRLSAASDESYSYNHTLVSLLLEILVDPPAEWRLLTLQLAAAVLVDLAAWDEKDAFQVDGNLHASHRRLLDSAENASKTRLRKLLYGTELFFDIFEEEERRVTAIKTLSGPKLISSHGAVLLATPSSSFVAGLDHSFRVPYDELEDARRVVQFFFSLRHCRSRVLHQEDARLSQAMSVEEDQASVGGEGQEDHFKEGGIIDLDRLPYVQCQVLEDPFMASRRPSLGTSVPRRHFILHPSKLVLAEPFDHRSARHPKPEKGEAEDKRESGTVKFVVPLVYVEVIEMDQTDRRTLVVTGSFPPAPTSSTGRRRLVSMTSAPVLPLRGETSSLVKRKHLNRWNIRLRFEDLPKAKLAWEHLRGQRDQMIQRRREKVALRLGL